MKQITPFLTNHNFYSSSTTHLRWLNLSYGELCLHTTEGIENNRHYPLYLKSSNNLGDYLTKSLGKSKEISAFIATLTTVVRVAILQFITLSVLAPYLRKLLGTHDKNGRISWRLISSELQRLLI